MKSLAIIASLSAMLAVILGAFGAHGLKALIEPSQLNTFEIGVRYQFYHSLAIFVSFFALKFHPSRLFKWAGWAFFIGILLFSGSLYLLACRSVLGLGGLTFILGPATPIGGVFFIIGWGLMLTGFLSEQND